MQQECCYEIMYHHPKYFRNFSLSCRFFPPYFHIFFFFFGPGVKCSRWLVLQHSSKQENMQDVGGRGGAGIWRALWNSSGHGRGLGSKTERVVSQFLESQKFGGGGWCGRGGRLRAVCSKKERDFKTSAATIRSQQLVRLQQRRQC